MGIYKRLRQLLPKSELMSRENHFRKYEFLSKLFGTGPPRSGMTRTQPSSFTGNICVGKWRPPDSELGHLLFFSQLPLGCSVVWFYGKEGL